jgi:hypothetical protein
MVIYSRLQILQQIILFPDSSLVQSGPVLVSGNSESRVPIAPPPFSSCSSPAASGCLVRKALLCSPLILRLLRTLALSSLEGSSEPRAFLFSMPPCSSDRVGLATHGMVISTLLPSLAIDARRNANSRHLYASPQCVGGGIMTED